MLPGGYPSEGRGCENTGLGNIGRSAPYDVYAEECGGEAIGNAYCSSGIRADYSHSHLLADFNNLFLSLSALLINLTKLSCADDCVFDSFGSNLSSKNANIGTTPRIYLIKL